ncbi:MAG TPA: response regulator [Abditibacteriaceae bacterium]|nr:response regulator [Abditibacteriaceae bacterium]
MDDEPDNIFLLEKMLRTWGYENLTTTTDSREAFELWKRHRPDLVFLDWMMPHVDGCEITQQIRAEAGENFSPVVVLTADISRRTRRQALAAGARDFLNKPFDSVEVLLRMENLLEMRFLYLELQNKSAQLEKLQKDIASIED